MGIRGLATFIASYSDKYLEDYELRDCHLVIDGNSFACQLHASSSKFNSAFGGDYDRIAAAVIEFVRTLRKCNISPLVIFDGGYEKHKLRTTYSRLKEKWRAAKGITPNSKSSKCVFPCFLKDVVKDVLRELHVPFGQCSFEADVEIAAIARYLKCPVLSYDSDFFVYDVLYIPSPTLHLYPYKDMSAQSNDTPYYLSCKLYRVERFLKRNGGLKKEILPLLSIMLGCDYVGGMVYRYFVSNLKQISCRGSSLRHRRIKGLLEWLRSETLESAKSKVLRCLRKYRRDGMKEKIHKLLSMYVEGSSELLPFLGFEVPHIQSKQSSEERNVMQVFEENVDDYWQESGSDFDLDVSENEATSSSEDGSSDNEDLTDVDNDDGGEIEKEEVEDLKESVSECSDKQKEYRSCERIKASHLPQWFIDKFKQGEFPSSFMDMLIFQNYFVPPQAEDYDYPSSHNISLSLIAVIYGLIVGSECPQLLKCCVRKFNSRKSYVEITPILECAGVKFPLLDDLLKLSISQRLLILIETATLNTNDVKQIATLPSSWQLYVIALIFWARKTEQPKVNSVHIDALLLCVLLLDVIGKNVICLGTKKPNKKKKKNFKKVDMSSNNTLFMFSAGNKSVDVASSNIKINTKKNELTTEKTFNEIENQETYSNIENENLHEPKHLCKDTCQVMRLLELVSSEECGAAKKVLRPFCFMEERLKTRPKLFCITTVHSFAQFQSCLMHLAYLNALLGHPLPHCIIFRLFSGTFVYNMYNNLKQRSNTFEYINHQLSTAPSIVALFRVLREVVGSLIPNIQFTNHIKRKPRKKQKQKQKQRSERTEEAKSDDEDKSVDIDFVDPCNRFAALTVNN